MVMDMFQTLHQGLTAVVRSERNSATVGVLRAALVASTVVG